MSEDRPPILYDSNGDLIRIRSDPGLVCARCGYDNTPGPSSDGAPGRCEGCGGPLD